MMAQTKSDITKSALIRAATQLFGEKGFAATSTREIAAIAGTNIASIAYHFGSKEGLRLACAELIVEHMSRLRKDPSAMDIPPIVATAETNFEALVLRQAYMLLRFEEAEPMIRFFIREIYERSDVFDYIYENFFTPILDFLRFHWAEAIGASQEDAQSEENRLTLFSIIAQIAYFRIGQPLICQHMNWQDYDEARSEKLMLVLQSNIRAIIKIHRREK